MWALQSRLVDSTLPRGSPELVEVSYETKAWDRVACAYIDLISGTQKVAGLAPRDWQRNLFALPENSEEDAWSKTAIWRAIQGGLDDATQAGLNILEQLDGDAEALRLEAWWGEMRELAVNADFPAPMWSRGADFAEGLASTITGDAGIGCVYLIVGFKDGRLALTYVGRTGDKFARIGSHLCAMSLVAQGIKKKPALVYKELAKCDRCLIFPLLEHEDDSTSEEKRTTRAVAEGMWCHLLGSHASRKSLNANRPQYGLPDLGDDVRGGNGEFIARLLHPCPPHVL